MAKAAKYRVCHCPHYNLPGEVMCRAYPDHIEGVEHPLHVACSGRTVTCQPCVRAVKKTPQWMNQLMQQGYSFMLPPKRKPKQGQRDQKQLDFATLYED